MLVTLVQGRPGAKWHIRHSWAVCLACSDLGPFAPSRRALFDADDPDRFDAFTSPDGDWYIDTADICRNCFRNFLSRLRRHGAAKCPPF